jgi:hypothetical protein
MRVQSTSFAYDAASCHTHPVTGDARAVLGRASGALRLSYDHKGTRPATTFNFTEHEVTLLAQALTGQSNCASKNAAVTCSMDE